MDVGAAPPQFSAELSTRYRIERELGHGGMAVVYLATDVRHDRRVALKVLRPDLAAAIGAERFLQEIKTTANLQHPHIVPLLDSGEADGLVYYVMPFVEGEGLRDRLNRERQLPVADAVLIATHVASALDYAHRHGVVHRDIKPENILLHDGAAVVADFGIALAVHSAGGTRLTQTGLALGTPQYMAPEQAMGERTIDGRADIYALGAVLYEMLIGEAPFTGPSMQAIVARMLAEQPRGLTTQRRAVSQQAEASVLRALEKLPADRFATAGEFARALGEAPTIALSRMAPGSRRRVWPLAAAAVASAAVGLWAGMRIGNADSSPVVTSQIAASAEAPSEFRDVALSPDGSTLAYVSSSSVDGGKIWLRKLSEASATPLLETEGARQLFWAPDGSGIGFFANHSLKVIMVATGAVRTLAPVPLLGAGGAWGPDGTILYSPFFRSLYRVPAAGGPTVRALNAADDSTEGSRDASFLPDGHRFLYWRSVAPNLGLWVGDLRTRETRRVPIDSIAGPMYVPPGYLLYFQFTAATTLEQPAPLIARPFDANRLVFTGEPVVLSPSVDRPDQAAVVSATRHDLVFRQTSSANAGGAHGTIYWLDRKTGRRGDPVRGTGAAWAFRSSHDGRRFAIAGPGLSIYDPDRDVSVKLPVAFPLGGWPQTWSPDDREIAANAGPVILIVRVDGSAPTRSIRIEPDTWIDPLDWSSDGYIYYVHEPVEGRPAFTLRRYNLATGKTEPVPSGSGNVFDARLSPDWKWIAYESDQSGRREIYLGPTRGAGTAIRVSKNGGGSPRWRRDGKELFFLGADGRIMFVPVQLGTTPALGEPRRVADLVVHPEPMGADPYLDTRFEPSPNGDRFLVQSPIGAGTHELTLMQGWQRKVKPR